MEKLKQYIYIILIGVVIICGSSYFGVKQYQTEKIDKEKIAQEAQQEKDKQIEDAEKARDLEFGGLRNEIEALKKKKQEVITQTIIKEIPATDKGGENSLSYVAQYWRPVIAYVECDREGIDQFGNISHIGYVTGSGTAVYVESTGQYTVWTNRHVMTSSGGKLCRIWFPDTSSPLISIKARINPASDQDFAIIDIPYPNQQLGSVIKNTSDFCMKKPSIGDQVVILGYPGIGSQTDITVTEGIISGYDGDYFITSAKVEQGNSGGAAILVKDNCYLGIPTFVATGVLESLARILDWHKFNN